MLAKLKEMFRFYIDEIVNVNLEANGLIVI